jgi:hypothetical protein
MQPYETKGGSPSRLDGEDAAVDALAISEARRLDPRRPVYVRVRLLLAWSLVAATLGTSVGLPRANRPRAWLAPDGPCTRTSPRGEDGGGGNRTRVRGRTGQSVYKRRLPLEFARRPVGSRPTAGLVILWCRTSGDDVPSVPSPFVDAACRTTGRARSDALRYFLGSESECRVVFRTCIDSRLFYEANRGPRLAALPANRPRRNLVAPVCLW